MMEGMHEKRSKTFFKAALRSFAMTAPASEMRFAAVVLETVARLCILKNEINEN